jgi:hypothetical protein
MNELPDPRRDDSRPPRGDAPTYEGSRFPWWLTALWVVFLVWGAVYLLAYFLPDLKTWLPGR